MAATNYFTDGEDFVKVNTSNNTLVATTLPQGAVDYYNSLMNPGDWYRYYDILNTGVYEASDDLRVVADVNKPNNGILQKLSGLTIGKVYSINLVIDSASVGVSSISVYSGTTLIDSHIIANNAGTQIIQFTATSTEETILISGAYIGINIDLTLTSISVTEEAQTGPYLTGLAIKPFAVSVLGVVTFTSGNDANGNAILVRPNQYQCNAYGYTYNKVSGTCSSFKYNTNLNSAIANENNQTYGVGNTTETGTNNTLIMGINNTVRGFSRNSIITGNENVISNGVNNANISGTLGEATADNSIVLGGNNEADALGERQNITLMYGTATTNSSTTDSFLNNTTNSYFTIPTDTIVIFETQTVAVRTGGTGGGNPGDYKAWSEVGVAINKSGVLSIDSSRDTISSSGSVSGWVPTVGVSGTNFLQQVKGANNRNIMWATTIRFTQIKTGVTL